MERRGILLEHVGLINNNDYRKKWQAKKAWYEKHFPDQLIITEEGGALSVDAKNVIKKYLLAGKGTINRFSVQINEAKYVEDSISL